MLKFYIQLLVRSYLGLPSSTISIQPVAELDSVRIDVAIDDVNKGHSAHKRQHALERW
jgi:hypothetical protein